jgi:hypothetical protein
MNNTITRAGASLVLAVAVGLAGCGGGGGGYSAPSTLPGQNPSGGISGTGAPLSTAGAITVNATAMSITGVTVGTASTTVVKIDDTVKTAADVKNGMTGKVRGRTTDNRVTMTAEAIEIENEVQGLVQSVQASAAPQRFTVNGQTVYVDDQTVYGNLTNFAALVAGSSYVEVYGLRDSTGAIRATRVESQTQGAPGIVDEIRGTVTAVGTGSFTLGSAPNAVTVTYTGSTTFTTGTTAASITVGREVEVHGTFTAATTTFAATRIDIEDVEDSSLAPGNAEGAEVEGLVSGFTSLTSTFKVGAATVSVSSATRFEGGTAADLANDRRVEAEGSADASGVLVATKVQFKSVRIIVQYRPSAVDPTARTLTILTNQVVVNDLTKVSTLNASGGNSTSLSDIVAGSDCVEVRGARSGTSIVADEVKELSGGSCKAILQGPVTAKTATTITTLGMNVDLSAVPAGALKDASGNAMTLTAFLAAITPNAATGTLVKSKGNVSGATVLAEEAELEN